MAVAHRLVPLLVSALVMALMSLSPGEAAGAQRQKSPASQKAASKSKSAKTTASTAAKKSPSNSRAATTKKSASVKKSPVSSKKSTASSKKTASKSGKKSAKRSPRVVKPRGQQEPTPERYKEIQQALIDRGYLAPPPTGVWGPESVAALRRFQQEQNLQATGKLDSLSLIALGLGPKYSATAQVRPNHENRSSQGNQGP